MGLFIEIKRPYDMHQWVDWHVGEPIPEDLGRVVKFQADGDELNLFLDAMAASRGDDPKVQWTKFKRFEAFGSQSPADPFGLIAATLTFPDGREIKLTQRAVDVLINHELAEAERAKNVVYGELAAPSND